MIDLQLAGEGSDVSITLPSHQVSLEKMSMIFTIHCEWLITHDWLIITNASYFLPLLLVFVTKRIGSWFWLVCSFSLHSATAWCFRQRRIAWCLLVAYPPYSSSCAFLRTSTWMSCLSQNRVFILPTKRNDRTNFGSTGVVAAFLAHEDIGSANCHIPQWNEVHSLPVCISPA